MNYHKFLELVRNKEKANVDFKITCDAFLSKRIAPKAELAKDICAMANNGNKASYIIIGISDDGRSFKSVSNQKLTDDNIQVFCNTAIFPPPRIRVHKKRWTEASPSHTGKDFVIIQVGPQARQAFRLARDFINYEEKVCLRRNEVWIRRGATSDIATPEEIARLIQARPPVEESKSTANVQYVKIPRNDQLNAMLRDFQTCVAEIGGVLYEDRVIVPVRNLRYVWKCIILRDLSTKFANWGIVATKWLYEHGVLLLVMGKVSRQAFHGLEDLHFREKWGYFTYYNLPNYFLPEPIAAIPVNTKKHSLVAFTLPNLADTDALRSSFLGLLKFLETDQESYDRIRSARDGMNANLRRWLKQGWLFETNRYYSGGGGPKRHELGKDEVFDKRFGRVVLKRSRDKILEKKARIVLDLSAGRLP